MRTRVKVVDTDGKKVYYPQYKGWFFWHSYTYGYYDTPYFFNDLGTCHSFIKRRTFQPVIKTYYLDFPESWERQ